MQPNILWICTDQQRYDTIYALNNPHIHTPNLDRLCQEGTAFTHAYCQSPVCTPSRASFLTGRYPSTIHVNRNGNAHFPHHVPLITKRLADAGYDCGLAGKLHIASAWNGEEERTEDGYRRFWYSHGPAQGIGRGNQYTEWLTAQGISLDEVFTRKADGSYGQYRPDALPQYHQTTWCADRAIEFMHEKREGPWLMSVNFFDPHAPFDPPASYTERYDPQALPRPLFQASDLDVQARLQTVYFQRNANPPDDQMQAIIAAYYGMIELIDEQLGRMLQALEETGQRENTLVIFMSDHGEMLGDHGLLLKGCRFYEGLVRVPLILRWPGEIPAGLVSHALVALLDIAPTLADLTRTPFPEAQGRSLLPLLRGEKQDSEHRAYVRCEYYDALNMHAPHAPEKHTPCWATMYRDERYKLVTYHTLDYGELYDLVDDPHEFHNLWEDRAATALKCELLKRSFDASITITDPGSPQIGRY